MTVEKEGECPICHGDILSNQSTYPVVIRIEGEHMRPGRVHQDCALENPEEYDKIAA